jgi:hypothetical protein
MRIAEIGRRGVVFLGVRDDKGAVDFGGTGFLVHYEERGVNVCYLITARHVAERLMPGFVVRANLKGGGSDELDHSAPYWAFAEDQSVDVAATIFALPGNRFENAYFRLNDGLVPESEVCCGDPISIIGLFRLHKGASRNVPIVHSGTVAALPDPLERIPINDNRGHVVEVLAYLVEAQTLDGLSGSPVWITRFAALSNVHSPFKNRPQVFAGMSLLGVYQGSWVGVPDDTLAGERKLAVGTRVPVGMGIVIPGAEVTKLILNHVGLAEHKEVYIKDSLESGTSLASTSPRV